MEWVFDIISYFIGYKSGKGKVPFGFLRLLHLHAVPAEAKQSLQRTLYYDEGFERLDS